MCQEVVLFGAGNLERQRAILDGRKIVLEGHTAVRTWIWKARKSIWKAKESLRTIRKSIWRATMRSGRRKPLFCQAQVAKVLALPAFSRRPRTIKTRANQVAASRKVVYLSGHGLVLLDLRSVAVLNQYR